jgi:ParB-like chromosome segregation protein Spo0J
MKVESVPIDSIVPDPSNPNFMSEEDMERLRFSYRKFGNLQPIIIDERSIILDGEHRWRILKSEGLKKIDIIRVPGLNDAQKKLLRQAMNKIHGAHDPIKDAEDFRFMVDNGEVEDLKKLLALDDHELKTYRELIESPELSAEDFEKANEQIFTLFLRFPSKNKSDIMERFGRVKGKTHEDRFLKLLEAYKA